MYDVDILCLCFFEGSQSCSLAKDIPSSVFSLCFEISGINVNDFDSLDFARWTMFTLNRQRMFYL